MRTLQPGKGRRAWGGAVGSVQTVAGESDGGKLPCQFDNAPGKLRECNVGIATAGGCRFAGMGET